ncbi:MAG TPA: protein-disulfide reductase DsbD domain-containing protein [Chitinophagaceae bacterium]
MRTLFLIFIICLSGQMTLAQVKDPVKWVYTAKKINPTTYEVQFTAEIEEDWHIYSQTTPDGGPVPTSISFSKNPLVKPSGGVKEVGKMEQHFEELFGVVVKQYSDKVSFVQIFNVKPGLKTAILASVEYMACNDHECMPPKKQSFSIQLK